MAKESKEEILERGTVNFMIGEGFGIILANIAQEHLTVGNDPIKALKSITDSLIGCPTEIGVLILKGDMVLDVDEESQEVVAITRIPEHEGIFPKIEPLEYMESRAKKIVEYGEGLAKGFYELQKHIGDDRTFGFDFNYETILKFIAGDDEALLDELRDNEEIDRIASLFDLAKRFITESAKTLSTIKWMMETFNEFNDNKNYLKYIDCKGNISDIMLEINHELTRTTNLNFDFVAPKDELQQYLDASMEIDIVLTNGIEPVDIMDNYSAGWLSQEGDYYALNGEIANMLHNQIADALVSKGIIPEKDEHDMNINPDSWLEQQGWVKIHGNKINYGGGLNHKLSHKGEVIKDIHMSDIQREMIYKYTGICHNGIIALGWRIERISSARFQMTDNLMLHKHYFSFD